MYCLSLFYVVGCLKWFHVFLDVRQVLYFLCYTTFTPSLSIVDWAELSQVLVITLTKVLFHFTIYVTKLIDIQYT